MSEIEDLRQRLAEAETTIEFGKNLVAEMRARAETAEAALAEATAGGEEWRYRLVVIPEHLGGTRWPTSWRFATRIEAEQYRESLAEYGEIEGQRRTVSAWRDVGEGEG